MVESEAKELSEDQMLGAVLFGHDEMQIAVKQSKNLLQLLVRKNQRVAPTQTKNYVRN